VHRRRGAHRAVRRSSETAEFARKIALLRRRFGRGAGLSLAPTDHMHRTRGRAIDVVLFLLAVVIIAAGVAYLNEDMHRQMVDVIRGDRSSQVAMLAASVTRLTRPILETFHSYWAINPWLVGFGIITFVMFIFMLKA
jgi:hypothetical protein